MKICNIDWKDEKMNEFKNRHNSASQQQRFNDLASSLLDFSTAISENQDEIIDYLSEHLYIQLHMAGHNGGSDASDSCKQHFLTLCRNVYFAEDDQSRRDAINKAKIHLAA